MEDGECNIGREEESFSIYLNAKDFQKNDVLQGIDNMTFTVISGPHRKWHDRLLKIITLGIYDCPTYYIVEIGPK